ncbi:hypothetical protein UCDDA912_g01334 [Diaporthe ampelina]|uniref:Uncharacterized protein n=1 Tax=Diaporthe ampelina TaxID=1214573 RepID=A0A0G2FX72_9PEZI|nr:hypothetical protein UCDDA912_g01334 [Diaporthe ampelina]
MCKKSYTEHEGCGCARIHATLPCKKAFDPSLPKCNPRVLKMKDKGDCLECKPAFDNKSGQKPRIKLNLKRKSAQQEVDQDQLKGTFAKIEQQHNQFRGFTRQERENHKTALFLDWIDNIEDPGPDTNPEMDDAVATFPGPSPAPGPPASTSPSWKPEVRATTPSSRTISREQRRLLHARRAREARQRGKITPSPLPTPPRTMTQVLSASFKDEYTLKARHHLLTADQRDAMRRSGFENICRLSVISRRHHQPRPMGDGSSLTTRRHTLSAGQRAALRRQGYGNVRRLSVVRRRPPPTFC